MKRVLIICILSLSLSACCCFSSSNNISVLENARNDGTPTYYMGSTSSHHHFWIGGDHNSRHKGYKYKISKRDYRVLNEIPFSNNRYSWVDYDTTVIDKSYNINVQPNMSVNDFKYRNTKIRRWHRPIKPRIINE